jgi:hypothetical protein
VRDYLSVDGQSWSPEIVCALVFTTKAEAELTVAQAEDATGIAEGRESWYVVRDEPGRRL